MLATADHGECTRVWLQEHLWSRSFSQGSLRRELSTLRKRLSGYNLECLPRDVPKDIVKLDLSCINVDLKHANAKIESGRFLEGLLIDSEPKFHEWVSTQSERSVQPSLLNEIRDSGGGRQYQNKPWKGSAVNSQRRYQIRLQPIQFDVVKAEQSLEPNFFNDILDRIAKLIICSGGIEIIDNRLSFDAPISPRSGAGKQFDADLNFRVARSSKNVVLNCSLLEYATGRIIFSSREVIYLDDGGEYIVEGGLLTSYISCIADECLFKIAKSNVELSTESAVASALVYNSIESMFNLTNDGIAIAEQGFDQAVENYHESVFYAWRAYLTTMQLEFHICDQQTIMDTARHYSALALEADRFNPLTLSLLTHVHAFALQDLQTAELLMQQALQIGSDHVMTYDAKSLLSVYRGDFTQAREAASCAILTGRFLTYRYLFMTTMTMIDALEGKYEAAIISGERALLMQPGGANTHFPPLLRYLARSCTNLGLNEKSARYTRMLIEANETKSGIDSSHLQLVTPGNVTKKFLMM